jgi:hypothetical protein
LAFFHPQAELRHIRMCFDAFFEQFPLCFGYWKKYADLELKKAGAAGAKATYVIQWNTSPFKLRLFAFQFVQS